MKRKGWIILAVAAVLVIGTYSWLKGSYNDMVLRREAATAQLGNVENQYLRRSTAIRFSVPSSCVCKSRKF